MEEAHAYLLKKKKKKKKISQRREVGRLHACQGELLTKNPPYLTSQLIVIKEKK
jgi:hypothetical protein